MDNVAKSYQQLVKNDFGLKNIESNTADMQVFQNQKYQIEPYNGLSQSIMPQTTRNKNQKIIIKDYKISQSQTPRPNDIFIKQKKILKQMKKDRDDKVRQREEKSIQEEITFQSMHEVWQKKNNIRKIELAKSHEHKILKEGFDISIKSKIFKEINLKNMEDEDPFEKKGITALFFQYKNLIKMLFRTCQHQVTRKKIPLFQQFNEFQNLAHDGDILQMFRQRGFTKQVILQSSILQIINKLNYGNKDLQYCSYKVFKQILLQMAFYLFPNLSPTLSFSTFFLFMREGTRQANLSTQLFDDPDIGGIGDSEVMKVLNEQLEKNPETTVPEGYKVKQIMNVNITYQASQRISQVHQLAFQILDQIIFKNFQTHLLIPEIQIVKVLKVKGVLKKPDMSSLTPLYKRIDYYDPQKSKNFNRNSYLNKNEETAVMKTQEEIREIKPKLRPLIKLEVAKQPASYQPFYTEVAEVCEEILTAVENEMNSLPRRPHLAPGRIENNILRIKYQKQEEEEAKKQQKEQNYQKHFKWSTKNKQKIEEENKQKQIKEEEQKKEQTRIEQEKQQKLEELKLKKTEENKQKTIEFKQKREAEKKQKEKESKKIKIIDKQKLEEIQKKTEKRQIKAENLTIQRRQVVVKLLNKQLEQKGAIDYDFIERHKKQEKKILEQVIQRKEKEKEKLNLLKQVVQRSDIKKVLKQYRFQTKYMFDAMIKINTKKIEENISEALQHMQLVEWMRFNAYLNVIPILITREDSTNIFRQLTIVKDFLAGEKPYITYDEFQDGLVRIGIYAYDALKQYYGEEQAQKGFKDTKDIIELQPDSFTGEMLEYLFQYLQLPRDRKKLEERFKMFQGNNYKTFSKSQMISQMLFGNKNPDEESNEQNLNNQHENDGSKTERVYTKKSISNSQDQEGFLTHREQPKPLKQKEQKKQSKNNLNKQEKKNTQLKESVQEQQDQESSEDSQNQKEEKKQQKNDANSQNQKKVEANQKEESSEDEDQIQTSKNTTESKQVSKAANKK